MKHDILGEIERTDGHPFDGIATIRYGSRDIEVGIIRDDQPFYAGSQGCIHIWLDFERA